MSHIVGDGNEAEADETAELAADLRNQEDVEAVGSGQSGADPGKQAHDEMVVSAVVEKAKEWAREVGMHYDSASLKDALGILPKVSICAESEACSFVMIAVVYRLLVLLDECMILQHSKANGMGLYKQCVQIIRWMASAHNCRDEYRHVGTASMSASQHISISGTL
jgi:hypothetical protein